MHELGFCLLILGIIGSLVLYDQLKTYWRNYKAQQKTKASEPIDLTGIDFNGDRASIKQRIKVIGYWLRLLTWGRRGKGV